jgi:hypothetical protein
LTTVYGITYVALVGTKVFTYPKRFEKFVPKKMTADEYLLTYCITMGVNVFITAGVLFYWWRAARRYSNENNDHFT